MTPKWEGHVYDHTGPIAAYERLDEANGKFTFTCSLPIDRGRGFSINGISLVSDGWVTLSGQIRMVVAKRW